MRKLASVVLFVVLMLLVPAFMKRMTKGFRVAALRLEFPHHPEWEVALDPEVLAILDQPFFYMDKGSQCYVFESSDGKHVLKFFRYDQPASDIPNVIRTLLLGPGQSPGTEWQSSSSFLNHVRCDKALHLFNACKAAYDHLREETALIYIHLNPNFVGLPALFCKDPIGRSLFFDLNQCRFAIQKKVMSFHASLEEAKKDPLLMQRRIDQFIDLLIVRTDKGILNSDPSLSRNFGFLENRAIELDFGNYRPTGGSIDAAAEIQRYTKKMKKWLLQNAPEYVDYLDARVEAL
ncbi:MAG: hypothetical protein ACD_17C00043G0003 [uncultured bacterium]|nr:MAG: hypothetical protein ACD_17C00043G0003 [uncultured bacterium]